MKKKQTMLMIPTGQQEILSLARDGTVAFLTAGDPMVSTTHADLRLRPVPFGNLTISASLHFMDETGRAIIEGITVRYDKPREIPGGHKVSVFYDTRLLSPNDLARLAAQATGHLDHNAFDVVLGVAYNGIFFAAAVAALAVS